MEEVNFSTNDQDDIDYKVSRSILACDFKAVTRVMTLPRFDDQPGESNWHVFQVFIDSYYWW